MKHAAHASFAVARSGARTRSSRPADFDGCAQRERRLTKIASKRQPITRERLEQIARNPEIPSRAIPALFGYGPAVFFSYLAANQDLWEVYERARILAGRQPGRFRPTESRERRRHLSNEELTIVNTIASDRRRFNDIRQAMAHVEPARFAAILYNLEHEQHEIWSRAFGNPAITLFFTRDESEADAESIAAGSQRKEAA